MSMFCGKCDLWDSLVMIREINDESDWSKIKIYQHTPDTYFDETGLHGDMLLDIKCLKDLLPYAAHLIGMSYGDKDGNYIAHISSRSFVDEEEEERFTWYLDEVKKLYRHCKRKKIEFTEEYVLEQLSWLRDTKTISEFYRRVKEHPCTKDVSGLHSDIHQYFRKELVEAMVEAGYTRDQADEWVYHHNKTW